MPLAGWRNPVTKRIVVALVCDTIHPYSHGGREQRYHELARRLTKDFELHVYTMQWWDGPREYTDAGVTFHAISPLLPLYTNGRRSIKQAVIFAFACVRLIRRYFDILDADHMPYFQVFVLRLIAALKRKPFIVTWHEVWSRSYWFSYLGWTGLAGWMTEWLAMRTPRIIIAASPHTADRLRTSLGGRASIATIPNGIDFETIRDTPPSAQSCDLVTVGRLIDHKRVDMLLDVIAMLHERGVKVTCRVIGDGPERDALHDQARKLHINHAVQFHHDLVEQKDVYALLKAGRIFVSLSAREGFGIAVLEALACGLSVVTTTASDNLAQHLVARSSSGRLCEPSVQAIADTLQGLLDEPSPEISQATHSEPWLADYDWEVMAEHVSNIYMRAARVCTL